MEQDQGEAGTKGEAWCKAENPSSEGQGRNGQCAQTAAYQRQHPGSELCTHRQHCEKGSTRGLRGCTWAQKKKSAPRSELCGGGK